MRLRSVYVRNFRGIREAHLDFTAANGSVRLLTGVFGNNGSGKTTLLQAIALTLAVASGRSRRPEDFEWFGYLPERVGSLGQTSVELLVELDSSEIQATMDLYSEWSKPRASQTEDLVPPAEHARVTLAFDGSAVRAVEGRSALYQIRGRRYLSALSLPPAVRAERLWSVGGVFWFDQHRGLALARNRVPDAAPNGGDDRVSAMGMERLRRYLVGMWTYHVQGYKGQGVDYVPRLEEHLSRVFPGTRIVGVQPRGSALSEDPDQFYFLFERGGKVYDLAEMASGEQAVFPLVYEFVRLHIARSIVLIDELEMHLHPPEQQALLAALPRLGPDCQFIVTSHSPYLADVLPADAQVRLSEGRLCR